MEDGERPWYRRPGWLVSAFLHVGIVVLTFISFAPTYVPQPAEEFVPVSMLPIAEKTEVKPATKSNDPKPDPKPAAKPDPKPKTAPTVPEPKPEPEPTPPKPDPKPAPPEPAPPKPEPPAPPKEDPPPPAPVADAEPAPAPPTPRAKPKEVTDPPQEVATAEPDEKPPEKKPEKPPEKKPEKPPKKPDKEPDPKPEDPPPFDVDAVIAGVEDKEKDDDTPDDAPEETPPSDDKTKRGKGNPTARETAAIQDAFKTQVSRCWSPPVGAPSPEKLIVVMRIKLNQDGSLQGMPEYMEPDKLSDPYYRAAAESGRRAIMQCQKYDLPAESYDQWSILEVEFDPSKMIGL